MGITNNILLEELQKTNIELLKINSQRNGIEKRLEQSFVDQLFNEHYQTRILRGGYKYNLSKVFCSIVHNEKVDITLFFTISSKVNEEQDRRLKHLENLLNIRSNLHYSYFDYWLFKDKKKLFITDQWTLELKDCINGIYLKIDNILNETKPS